MAVDRTTLAAVNYMLTRIGVAKVTALGAHKAATQAEDLLNEVAQNLQSEPWYFNTEPRVYLPASELGYREVPTDVIHVDHHLRSVDVAIRDGALYNLREREHTWDKPTNHILDPSDLSTGNWTSATSFGTIDPETSIVTSPRGRLQGACYVVDDSGAAVQYEEQAISTLTDGTRYRLSGYFRNGPDQGAQKPSLLILQSATVTAGISFFLTTEPPTLRTYSSDDEGNGQIGLLEDAKIHILDDPSDTLSEGYSSFAGLAASWCFVSGEFVYDSSLGTPTVRVQTHEDAAQAANTDMFVQGLQLCEAASGPQVTLVRNLPYEQLDPAVQEYVRAEAIIPLQDIVLGSETIRRELIRLRDEARMRLWEAQASQSDVNTLTGSYSTSRFYQRHRSPLLVPGGLGHSHNRPYGHLGWL